MDACPPNQDYDCFHYHSWSDTVISDRKWERSNPGCPAVSIVLSSLRDDTESLANCALAQSISTRPSFAERWDEVNAEGKGPLFTEYVEEFLADCRTEFLG